MDTNLVLVRDKTVEFRWPTCWRIQEYQWEVLDSCGWVLWFSESGEEIQLTVYSMLLVKR